MINNYIFDFGNVIGGFNPIKLTKCCITDNERAKYLSKVVFDRLYFAKLDDGSYTDEDVKLLLKERLDGDLYDDACLVFDSWVKNLEKIEGMDKLIADIKASGKKVYLLSNISHGFAKNHVNVEWINDILSQFDGIVFSAKVGMVKPDIRIFEHILNKYSLEPSECIFVDDAECNIKGCEAVGIKGYLFDGDVNKLRKYLGY